jgi:hypothetical protein
VIDLVVLESPAPQGSPAEEQQ